MLLSRSQILAKSIKHYIQLSTTNTIYIYRFTIVMFAFQKQLYCKKGVLKNFPLAQEFPVNFATF